MVWHTTVFVSYALSDAVEKILVARQVYEQLPSAFQKKLVTDSKTELAFASNKAHGRISRIVSVPSKAPRGTGGDILLDEFAHYVADREVYRGSTALILRSQGQLTGCSTPLGRRGIWEIVEELRKDFQQELEVKFMMGPRAAPRPAPAEPVQFVDESFSYFPYELILPCTADDLEMFDDFSDFPPPEGRIVAGFDVGRTRDYSELAVFEERNGRFTCRLLRRYEQIPFAAQEAGLRMLETLPVARLSLDQSGIGMNLAENLARDYPQVVREVFSNEAKERWATDFKILHSARTSCFRCRSRC